MKKGQMIALLLAVLMLAISISGIVHAAETEEPSGAIGDELPVIENADTARTENTPCQITVKTEVPDGFGHSCFVLLSDEAGRQYRISTSQENGYSDYIFVSSGAYSLISSGVYGDNVNQYTFSVSEESLTLDENTSASITARLEQYDEVSEIIAEKTGQKIEQPENGIFDKLFDTGLDGVQIDENGNLWYEAETNCTDRGLSLYGSATGDYDILCEITSGGCIGEAEYRLSFDGGKTFSLKGITGVDETTGKGVKLKFHVEDKNGEYEPGDTFKVHVYETFRESKPSLPAIIIKGHPETDHVIGIKVLTPGTPGKAKFTLFDNDEATLTDVIPENGVLEIADGMELVFTDAEYPMDRRYEIHVKSNSEVIDYTPLYIMGAGVWCVAMVLYYRLLMKKECISEYQIHVWKKRQDDEAYTDEA